MFDPFTELKGAYRIHNARNHKDIVHDNWGF